MNIKLHVFRLSESLAARVEHKKIRCNRSYKPVGNVIGIAQWLEDFVYRPVAQVRFSQRLLDPFLAWFILC